MEEIPRRLSENFRSRNEGKITRNRSVRPNDYHFPAIEAVDMASFPIGVKDLVFSTLAIIALEVIAALFIYPALSSPLPALALTRIAQIGTLFLVLSLNHRTAAAIGLGRNQIISGLSRGLFWSLIFGLCTLAGMAAFYLAGTNPISFVQTALPRSGGHLVLFFVTGGLVAPVAEEVFFRGIVYAFLRRWGIPAAIIGTTLIFVALHTFRHGLPITQTVGGIVFCAAYEKERKLMTPIVIHALGNTAIFALSAIA